jgi:hypothetical protein
VNSWLAPIDADSSLGEDYRRFKKWGLAAILLIDSTLQEICTHATGDSEEIAGADAVIEIQELARQVAEAQIDLCRVRNARHHALTRGLPKSEELDMPMDESMNVPKLEGLRSSQ